MIPGWTDPSHIAGNKLCDDGQVNLHWIRGVPVDVAQPVGGGDRLADELDEHQKQVDGGFRRHFLLLLSLSVRRLWKCTKYFCVQRLFFRENILFSSVHAQISITLAPITKEKETRAGFRIHTSVKR